MSSPLVTVFIPVYNAQNYIEQALLSIMNQSYDHLEILIIDDGSTDDTVKIIETHKQDDYRIKLLENKQNRGIPYTRNRGLSHAKGDYLAVMDADDVAHLDRIQEQVDFMEYYPHIDAAGCNFKQLGKSIFDKKKSKFYDPEELNIRLFFASPIANPSSIIRMDTIKKHNIWYNEKYFVAQDYDFWFQIAKAGQLGMVPQYLMNYRVGHNNISKRSRSDKTEERRKIIQDIHINILNYYNFNLEDKAYSDYLLFFDDGYHMSGKEIDIRNMAYQLLNLNYRENTFKASKFKRVLSYSIAMNISNLSDRLIRKINMYLQLVKITKRFSFIEIARIVAKHYIKGLKEVKE